MIVGVEWSEGKLERVLAELRAFGDDTTLVECKTAEGGLPEDIGKTLAAFANMPQTGTILFGISQARNFFITGVTHPAQLEKALVSANRNSVDPAPQLEICHVRTASGTVMVVEIQPLLPGEKPALYRGKPYLRQADGNYVMNSNDLKVFALAALSEAERVQPDFEILPGTSIEMLEQPAVEAYIASIRAGRSRLSAIEDKNRILQIANVCDEGGNLRLAGLYALGFLPQATEPALGATAAVRTPGWEERGRLQNLVELEGPIPAMLDEGVDWILRNTNTASVYGEDGHMSDSPEFPPRALREIIANALVHRDLGASLGVGKKVEIRITPKMVIIKNPGGLKGVTVEQLESSVLAKAAVNRRLYEIARNLRTRDGKRVIEGEGGGIAEVISALREARCAAPRFIDSGVEFTVILPRGPRFNEEEMQWLQTFSENLAPLEEDLLVMLRDFGELSVTRVERTYSELSHAACKRMLGHLEDIGAIRVEGGVISLAETLPVDAPPALPTGLLEGLGPNAPAVYKKISAQGSATVRDLSAGTGLSDNQVRYALQSLLKEGLIVMNGRQGVRSTTYETV